MKAKRGSLVFFGCVIALGTMEAGVRVFDPQPMLPYRPHPSLGWTLPAGARYTVVEQESGRRITVRINSKGLRDVEHAYDKPAGIFRILVIGDSFTEGTLVELDEAYPKQLERRLRERGHQVEVINAGVGGYGTDQELLFLMREGLRYHPDLVLLGFFAGNDVSDTAAKSIFRLERGSVVMRDQRPPGLRRRAVVAVKAVLQHLQSYLLIRRVTSSSASIRTILGRLGLLEADDAERIRGDVARWGKPLPPQERLLLAPLPPDLQAGWELTAALLDQMRRVTDAAGSRLLIAAIPSGFQVERPRFQRLLAAEKLSLSDVDREAPTRMVVQWAAAHRVPAVDLLPALREAAGAGSRLYLQEGHWTRDGHAMGAALIAQAIAREGWLALAQGSRLQAPGAVDLQPRASSLEPARFRQVR